MGGRLMPTPKEYQEMLSGGCPWCGEALEIRRGRYGEFIACVEWCGYTKNIPGRSFFLPEVAVKKKCPVNKCDGSGLIPFVKNGKVIPDARIYCECHPIYGLNPEPEHYRAFEPEDFDFPMSDTFRGFSYAYCGLPDPGYYKEPEETKPQVVEHIVRHSDMGKKEFDLLQQTVLKTQNLDNKLTEHLEFKKKPIISKSKGIKIDL
jgi:ssDNA-binding Zn-finger/Zn-ribbon topoisomerase 1